MAKRDLFAELMQGISEMAEQRQGKVTLHRVTVEQRPVPIVTAQEIVELRKNVQRQNAC